MNILLLNFILAFAWTLLSGDFSLENLFVGFVIGYIVLFVAHGSLDGTSYFKKIPKIIIFFMFFFKELVKANLQVAYDILTSKDYMKPGIIAFELTARTDIEITLLANVITLTPGTLSLDTSSDKKILFVHAMYIDDVKQFKHDLRNGFEKKLLEILR